MSSNSEVRNTFFRLALFCVLGLLLFTPLMFGYTAKMESILSGTPTAQAMQDPIVALLIIASASILIPGLLDNILDYFFVDQIDSYLLERTVLLFGLFISYCGQFLAILSDHQAAYYIIFFVFNIWMYLILPLLTLYRINPIFSGIPFSILITISYTFLMCAAWNTVADSTTVTTAVLDLRYAGFALLLLVVAAYYYFEIFLKWKCSNLTFFNWMASNNAHLHTFAITTSYTIVIVIFSFLPVSLNRQPGFAYMTPSFIKAYYITSIVFILLLSVLPFRIVRREADRAQADLRNKKQFVRYISHELRTPISIIITGLDVLEGMIRKRDPVQEILAFITELKEPCNTGVEILNDILAYEKIDGGEMVLERTSVDPFPFLEKTVAPFRIAARNKSIELVVVLHLRPLKYSIYIDDTKIAQVLRNFLSNAIKFTPIEGWVEVTARVEESWLVVDVKDSGVGLSPENRNQLFTRAIQFNARAQQGGGGSGFGLLISKKIVDMHEGEIDVFSEGEGRGTTFRMKLQLDCLLVSDGNGQLKVPIRSLDTAPAGVIPFRKSLLFPQRSPQVMPMRESVMEPPPEPEPPAAEEKDEFSDIAGMRVLIVDDSALNRKVMRKRLEADGYACREADDGDVAVAFMERTACKDVDIITMDNMMPRMRGTEAAAKIRKLGYKGIIIGLTGNALDDDVKDFTNHGANKVMPKPFDLLEFKKMVLVIHRELLTAKSKGVGREWSLQFSGGYRAGGPGGGGSAPPSDVQVASSGVRPEEPSILRALPTDVRPGEAPVEQQGAGI